MKITIGEEIKKERKEACLTQKELAKKAGIAEITLRKYEAESIAMTTDTLIKIARALDLDDYYFIGSCTKKELEFIEILKNKDARKLSQVLDIPLEIAETLAEIPNGEIEDKTENKRLPIDQSFLLEYYNKLNDLGKKEALKRVQELTEIPRYQKDNEEKE